MLMDAVVTPVEEPEERMEGDDYEYEADEEEPKNKFPDLCSKINCDEFAKVWSKELHRCWWRMLETKCVGDNYNMLVTILAILITDIHYLFTLAVGNQHRTSVTNIQTVPWPYPNRTVRFVPYRAKSNEYLTYSILVDWGETLW